MTPSRVAMTVLAAACAVPDPGWPQASLGLGAGVARPHGAGSQLWLTASVRWPLGRRLAVEPELAYWPGQAAPQDLLVEFKDVYLGGSALVRFPTGRLTVLAGGGGGIHRFDFTSDRTKPGAHALVAVDVRTSAAASLFAAARREWIRFRPDDLWVTRVYAGVRLAF